MISFEAYMSLMRNCILKKSGKECAKLLSVSSKTVRVELNEMDLEIWKQNCQNMPKPFDQLLPYRLKAQNYIMKHDWERAYEIQSVLAQYPFKIRMAMPILNV
jgi:hypothetical protein